MVQPVKSITVLRAGKDPLIRHLNKSDLGLPEGKKITYLDKIVVDPNSDKSVLEDNKVGEPVILKIGNDLGKRILAELPEAEGLKGKEGDAYIIDAKDKFLGFSEYEESVQGTLKTVNEILDRAYNRRTNVAGWVLFLYLRYFRFREDDYEPIRSILTYDPNSPEKSTDFIRKFAEYLKLREESRAKAEDFINSAFEGDSEKERKLGLVKLSCFVMNASNKLSSGFLNRFPLAFAIQNLAMPILANLVKTGFWGNLFHYMRMINPWIGDFLAEQVANFKNEIFKVQDSIESINDPFKDDKKRIETDGKDVIDEVKVTDLDKEEHSFKKVVQSINDVFDRLFGRQTTLSSWLFNGLLWAFTKYKTYRELAEDLVNKNDFVRNLLEHAKLVTRSIDTGESLPELPRDKFPKRGQRNVARIFLGTISLANALTPKFIKDSSNIFGRAFSIQNLIMPILSEFVKKGKIATLIHVLRDVNPFLNDMLDYVANYRKEIFDIQRENKRIKGILPGLSGKGVFKVSFRSLKIVWESIRSFSSKVFGKSEIATWQVPRILDK